MVANRRLGRFRMSDIVWAGANIDSKHFRSIMGLMGQMVIIRATDNPFRSSIDYWAISPLFDEINEGAVVPWYEIEFQTEDHGEDYADKGHSHQYESIAKAIQRKPPGEVW
jgi:hypothetical protein